MWIALDFALEYSFIKLKYFKEKILSRNLHILTGTNYAAMSYYNNNPKK